MYISTTSLVNLIIAVIGIVVSVFSVFILICGISKDKETIRLFSLGFTALLICHVCLLVVEFTRVYPDGAHRYLVLTAGFLSYVMAILTAYTISVYLVLCLSLEARYGRATYTFLTVYLYFQIVILLFAQFSGKLILINEQHQYDKGSLSVLGYAMIASYMMIDFILMIRYRANIRLKQRLAFAVFFGLPLLTVFIRVWFPGIYLVSLAASIALIIMLVLLMNEQQRIYESQRKQEEHARIDLMLSQIQPHFLFNSLYVIQEICHTDPETASRAIEGFSRYLRHNMDSIAVNRSIPFSEELEHTKLYVWLQQLRFGEVLDVQYNLAVTDFRMPSLALQPIVENAIRYGVRQNERGAGTVEISTAETDDYYVIVVADNGPGFDMEKLPDDGASHIGLNNVRERLRHISNGNLLIESAYGKGTKVTIQLPKDSKI